MIDLLSLQEKAEKAHKILEDASCPNRHVWDNAVWNRFTRVASPKTILSLCSELSAARESKWISVKHELPPKQELVLIAYTNYHGKRRVTMGWYCPEKSIDAMEFSDEVEGSYDEATDTFWMKEGWVDGSVESEYHYEIKDVTHWMPTPAPPTELLGSEKAAK